MVSAEVTQCGVELSCELLVGEGVNLGPDRLELGGLTWSRHVWSWVRMSAMAADSDVKRI